MNATQMEVSYAEIAGYPTRSRIGIVRVAVAGGSAAAIVLILCWLGTFIPFGSPTHAYVGLFTPAPMNSLQALAEGTFWSLLFGAFVAAVFATTYNLFAGLDRR